MKRGLIIGVFIILVIVLGIYFYPTEKDKEPTPTPSNCAGQGELIGIYQEYKECCEGLNPIAHLTPEKISIEDNCYDTGEAIGGPGGSSPCSNCGNGICEDVEGVCNCPEDCIGKNKSLSIEEFCNNYYENNCHDIRGALNLDYCKLCPQFETDSYLEESYCIKDEDCIYYRDNDKCINVYIAPEGSFGGVDCSCENNSCVLQGIL